MDQKLFLSYIKKYWCNKFVENSLIGCWFRWGKLRLIWNLRQFKSPYCQIKTLSRRLNCILLNWRGPTKPYNYFDNLFFQKLFGSCQKNSLICWFRWVIWLWWVFCLPYFSQHSTTWSTKKYPGVILFL